MKCTALLKAIALFFIIIILTPFAFSENAYARFATPDDMDVSIENYHRSLKIKKDGSYTETIAILVKVLKESGKDQLVSLPLVYNTGNSTLKVLEAKTINGKKSFPVDLKQIEEKPLASSPQGFDQNNQVLIAFPEISINSEVYVKYERMVTEAPVHGFFSTDFIYGMGQYCKKSQVDVTSEIPFFVQVNDPEQYLKINQSKKNNKYYLNILLQKPIIKTPVDEQFVSNNSKIYPWVTLSTAEQWPELGHLLLKEYNAVLDKPLPALFENIVKEASTKRTTIEKINTVTSKLAENISYMGDWRTVKGKFVPRELAEIAKSKLGDCKDFSAATVAILRKLSLKADVALISRGVDNLDPPNNLPNMFDFDHVFVRVMSDNKAIWVDPTNFTSFAQGIYPDVASRKTLVLDSKGPELALTHSGEAKDSLTKLFKKIILPKKESDTALVEGKVFMTGIHALPLIGADLKSSKESINHDIIQAIADENRIVNWNIDNYNLTSRIVHDVDLKFNYTEKHSKIKTTAGNAFIINTHGIINRLLTKTKDRITDLNLDTPSTHRREILLSNTSLVGQLSNCAIDSPWVSGKRMISNDQEGIRILDELIVKKDKILNSELKSSEYIKFQDEVYACFGETALVYNDK